MVLRQSVTIPLNATPDGSGTAPARQFAALCWRLQDRALEVLLISSRDTGRWVIPKGWPMEGLAPSAAAAREAWEEAGVTGLVASVELGSFSYDKQLKITSVACLVLVFALQVQHLADSYPESKQRQRKWVSPDEAAGMVQEPGLQELFAALIRDPAMITGAGRAAP